MIVQCPSCKTTYAVADNLIKNDKPTFRCSRCKHIFAIGGSSEVKTSTDPVSSPKESAPGHEEQELSFPFESKNQRTQSSSNDYELEPELSLNAFEGPERREKPWSLTGPTDCVQEPSEASREVVSQEASPEPLPASTPQHSAFDQSWWARGTLENGRAGEDLNAAGLSTAPFLTLSALLVVAFSTVTLVYLSQPAHLDRLLRAIPLLGSSIFKNNHLKDGMALQSVTARVQTIRGNREVFTISGQVHNHNTVSVREVRLEGYVYNADGKELGRQVISVGNPISERIIRDVEPKELSILQELSPQRRFEILPEQWVPFIIVFLKAKEISSFGYRVLSAAEVG